MSNIIFIICMVCAAFSGLHIGLWAASFDAGVGVAMALVVIIAVADQVALAIRERK